MLDDGSPTLSHLSSGDPGGFPHPWFRSWLLRLKRYFLLAHWGYILAVALASAICLYALERNTQTANGSAGLPFLDALFIAVSAVTCTGLTTFDMTGFQPASVFVWHLTMTLGGTVFTSILAPVLRLVILRRICAEELQATGNASPTRKAWGQVKRSHVQQLAVTSTLAAAATATYWFGVQFLGFVLLLSELPPWEAAARSIANFCNCVFSSAAPLARSPFSLLLFSFLTAGGCTLYAPLLRCWLYALRWVIYLGLSLRRRQWIDRHSAFAATVLDFDTDSTSGLPLNADPRASLTSNLEVPGDTVPLNSSVSERRATERSRNKWISGLNRILVDQDPLSHHTFLFNTKDSLYLLGAWMLIVLMQFTPFLTQQWSRGLAPYSSGQKVVIAWAQTVGNRFAGLEVIDTNWYTPAHVLIICFGLFLPGLPIPTDRTRRKWDALVGQGAWRLLTSRIWWLAVATVTIVFFEESHIQFPATHLQYDVNTRTIFEVLSAYATSGISLPLESQSNVDFCGAFSPMSKLILMAVMLMGRHRGMDLGLDLGLGHLEELDRKVNVGVPSSDRISLRREG